MVAPDAISQSTVSAVTQYPPKALSIKAESRAFFAVLGRHITQLRKQRGMTQAELARALGVSQQAVFAYEIGDRRVSVLILVKLSKVFLTPVGEIVRLAEPVPPRKRNFSPRAMYHGQRLQALSKTQQRFVLRIIDVLEASNSAPCRAKTKGGKNVSWHKRLLKQSAVAA